MGSAEQYGHNMVHLFVGGDMTNLNTSPGDPLFFFHHSNVDRIWAQWSSIWGETNYADAWKKEVVTGYVDADGVDAPGTAIGDTVNTERLGYRYDHLGALSLPAQREIWPGQASARRLRDTQKTFKMGPRLAHRRPHLHSTGGSRQPDRGQRAEPGRRRLPAGGGQRLCGAALLPLHRPELGVQGRRRFRSAYGRHEHGRARPPHPAGGDDPQERAGARAKGSIIQAETKPLAHAGGAVELDSFIVEYDAEFPFPA